MEQYHFLRMAMVSQLLQVAMPQMLHDKDISNFEGDR